MRNTVVLLFILSFAVCQSYGASVMQLNLSEAVNRADMIVRGRVSSYDIRLKDGQPWSCARIDIKNIIKGNFAEDNPEMCFYGDQGITTNIGGLELPPLQVDGFFLLYSPKKQYVNPLVGWHQGMIFVVRNPDDQSEFITNWIGDPIASIDEVAIRLESRIAKPALNGLNIISNADDFRRVSPAEFERVLYRIVGEKK